MQKVEEIDLGSLSPNKQLVVRYFLKLAEGDFDGKAEFMAEDVRITTPNGEFSKAEFLSAHQGHVDLLASRPTVRIRGMTEEGNRIAVESHSSMMLSNGNLYENAYHWLMVIRDGKFSEMREYTDTWKWKLASNRIPRT